MSDLQHTFLSLGSPELYLTCTAAHRWNQLEERADIFLTALFQLIDDNPRRGVGHLVTFAYAQPEMIFTEKENTTTEPCLGKP